MAIEHTVSTTPSPPQPKLSPRHGDANRPKTRSSGSKPRQNGENNIRPRDRPGLDAVLEVKCSPKIYLASDDFELRVHPCKYWHWLEAIPQHDYCITIDLTFFDFGMYRDLKVDRETVTNDEMRRYTIYVIRLLIQHAILKRNIYIGSLSRCRYRCFRDGC